LLRKQDHKSFLGGQRISLGLLLNNNLMKRKKRKIKKLNQKILNNFFSKKHNSKVN